MKARAEVSSRDGLACKENLGSSLASHECASAFGLHYTDAGEPWREALRSVNRSWHVFQDKKLASTPLSDFIRNASSAQKKRVYKEVIEKSTQQQQKVIDTVRAERQRLVRAG